MLDFLMIGTRKTKRGIEVYPKFIIKKSSDLMLRAGDFYAVWVEERGLWSTEEDDLIQLIDQELDNYVKKHEKNFEDKVRILYMWDAETCMIDAFHKYCQRQMRDNYKMLDEKLIFANDPTDKRDYASKRLSYPLEPGNCDSYEKIISTLYTPEERMKIEWAIGAIITGDSKEIQKFLVLYGEAGTGKSTILNIIQQLFEGYYSVFDAKALGSSGDQFALEAFKTNPLVAIQHDGDLSRIEDNTRLNSLVSHELMTVNEKFKGRYSNRFKSFLFLGTNKPVKITDAKSGLIRRLIDVSPSGNKLGRREYHTLTKQVKFELGAIACHCRDVYLANKGRYDDYIPVAMLGASNDFYNYVIDSYHIFKREDGTTLKAAWEMYKTYCDEAKVPYPYSQKNFKEELKNYFREYSERFSLSDGTRVRSYFSGFRTEKFEEDKPEDEEIYNHPLIKFEAIESAFDKSYPDYPAQYASAKETPIKNWDDISSTLSELDTSKLHFVRVPENHIVIDFDIKDKNGVKSFEKNLEEASKWPATYAELSKSGGGIHLHYIYTGDVSKLSRVYDDQIEIKVFTGKSSLRRKLTKCNNLPIATISSGLPLKGDKKMVNFDGVKNEKAIRTLIKRHLNKEIMGATKPSIDMIGKILDEAYESGISYDVSDMHNAVFAFAASSTNKADYCIKLVNKMHFKSEEHAEAASNDEAPIVFYDVEVFPNLFIVCWKYQGENKPIVKMINPTPTDIDGLIRNRLIGFNNRRYDDHILYARLMGYTNEQLYNLSQKIINGGKGAFFNEAYNLAYTDIYDFSSNKQSLKKWEIALGLHHQELGLPWDQPVDESLWETVADYCVNDVVATEAVFNELQGDWTARKILAELAGMSVNSSTNSLTTRIIFGRERKPLLVYTDLATGEQFYDGKMPKSCVSNKILNSFPGYEFVDGKNMYRNTDMGFGGYVYAEPGMYTNVALLDVQSMHPNSAVNLNAFGEYTQRFKDILDARVAIKHGDFEAVKKMFDGRLAPYLTDPETAADLAQALKIAINSVYGLTSANFENPFRDVRNKNNIVALRGALFMRTLQDEVQARGFTVAHIKTDSIKIPDATPEIIEFVMEFGKKYGYIFEHEATYDRMCLVNDAVYIAKYKDGKHAGEWTATGTQFQVPYVFKKLFSREPIEFEDMCETKSVSTALYLDMNEQIPEGEHDYRFVGKVGQFCPIKPGCGGGVLCREGKDKEGNVKYSAATGSKGYRWMESETVKRIGAENDIDRSYYDKMVDDAADAISKHGDFEWFVSELEAPPWLVACGKETCEGCPYFYIDQYHMHCGKGYDIGDMIALNKVLLDDENDDFKKR